MFKRFLLAANLLLLLSCVSNKWRTSYGAKRFNDLNRYATNDTFTFHVPIGALNWKNAMQLNKSEFIAFMDKLEYLVALCPDSVATRNGSTDSFYMHPAKIAYIQKMKITRANVHYIRKQ
jgi:hypothetical protein